MWTALSFWRKFPLVERAFFLIARRLISRKNYAAFNNVVFGFDISKYQISVDFSKMRQYGAKFLILRSSYGIKKDEMFDTYMPAALQEYERVGIYHFYEPLVSPYEQARTLLAAVTPYKNKISRIWLDLEFWWSGNYSAPQHWKALRDQVRLAGFKVGWYTRATWWDSRVAEYAADFATDPCWAAQYNTSLTLIPKGWTKAMIWQAGTPAIGIEAGVTSKEIDYNLWNDEFDFTSEWGSVQPPPQGEAMEKWQLITDLNLRNAPGVSGALIQTMPKGSFIWGIVDTATGWIAVKYLQKPGEQYASSIAAPAYCSGAAAYVAKQTYSDPPLVASERILTIKVTEPGWQDATVTVIQKKV